MEDTTQNAFLHQEATYALLVPITKEVLKHTAIAWTPKNAPNPIKTDENGPRSIEL